ncbi:MAG: hypothetical protein R2815_14080 [Flavobacteriales bacterium]
MILFKHQDTVTLAIIDPAATQAREQQGRAGEGDLIKDIRTSNPHHARTSRSCMT